MLKHWFRSYKTSILGLVAAGLQAHAGGLGWKAIAASLPTALLGMFAKDSDVTGVSGQN